MKSVKSLGVVELNHVALAVSNLELSNAFFKDVLKLEMLPRPAFDFPGSWFRLGTTQELHLIGGRKAPRSDADQQAGHLALKVADVSVVDAHLKGLGLTYLGPWERPDGATQLFIADPDGNWIEFFSPAYD
jgi:catechol 2,3-dioxygenase-like lactoylglutathione lyase family enzyme